MLKTKTLKREWLRAFFDCEAYVGKRVIQLQSVNNRGINQIKDLLNEFKIESKIYGYERKHEKWNKNYILCVMKKASRERFLKEIGFTHARKLEKLRDYLK